MKRSRPISDEMLELLVNSDHFQHDLDSTTGEVSDANITVDAVQGGHPIQENMPESSSNPMSPRPTEMVIECSEDPSGTFSVVVTPQKEREEPATVVEAIAGPATFQGSRPVKHKLYTSTPKPPKQRRIVLYDDVSDSDDPEYVPEDMSDDSDSDDPPS